MGVLQAPVFHGPPFDRFPLQQDGLASAGVDVGGGEIVQAFMVSSVIVVADEGVDLGLEVSWQELVFEQDAVFQCLVPTLDLELPPEIRTLT